jgi:hypothetical protein
MAKAGGKALLGTYSGTPHGGFVCQEVRARRSSQTVLEVRRTEGGAVAAYALDEASAGHQVTPDGSVVYVLTGGTIGKTGILRRLLAIRPEERRVREIAVSTSALPAVDDRHVAYFTETAIIVETHDGARVLEQGLGRLAPTQGSGGHACALLPNHRLAVSRGHRGAEKIADLTVLNLTDGREEQNIELPAASFFGVFAPAALRADPQGRLVAILGFHAGLLLVDLATGRDVADLYPPDPLDLADGRPTTHAHHTYSDLAFDRSGNRLAAAYRPGRLSVWARDGAALRREGVSINPKASRIVTFDESHVAFFDSMGASARFELAT